MLLRPKLSERPGVRVSLGALILEIKLKEVLVAAMNKNNSEQVLIFLNNAITSGATRAYITQKDFDDLSCLYSFYRGFRPRPAGDPESINYLGIYGLYLQLWLE